MTGATEETGDGAGDEAGDGAVDRLDQILKRGGVRFRVDERMHEVWLLKREINSEWYSEEDVLRLTDVRLLIEEAVERVRAEKAESGAEWEDGWKGGYTVGWRAGFEAGVGARATGESEVTDDNGEEREGDR